MSTLKAAIVGSGPSGFYAAEALFRERKDIQIDMFDRLPTPYGLVRGGVAPDHPKIKLVTAVYDKIANSPGYSFYGNVNVGADLTLAELSSAYHVVLFASGANTDRRLAIPGEDLHGSHTATEFVGWYNGHPDYRDCTFDLSQESAVIIGQGNVAADVARILATPVEALRRTDIAEHAIEALSNSRVSDIYIVGRRGPVQAKFTPVELMELGKIPGCDAIVMPDDLDIGDASATELENPKSDDLRKNFEIFRKFAAGKSTAKKRIHFRFLESPIRLEQDPVSRTLKLSLAKNVLAGPAFSQAAQPTSTVSELRCGLVFRSIGYRGAAIDGLEFDAGSGTIRNVRGRCVNGSEVIAGTYVTGWIKRGATGVIGTNRADSIETVASIKEDLAALESTPKPGGERIQSLLRQRNIRFVHFAQWKIIDRKETYRGKLKDKPREKFTRISEMIEACDDMIE